MFKFSSAILSQQRNLPRRNFSTTNKSTFAQISSFVSNNRQQLINICGAYLILAAGVTNYREKTIREEQLIAGETTRKELESIKRVIENKNELKEIEDIVKQSKKPDTLYTELTHRISNPVNTKVISAKGTTIAKGDEDIGKIVEQLGGNSSTRII